MLVDSGGRFRGVPEGVASVSFAIDSDGRDSGLLSTCILCIILLKAFAVLAILYSLSPILGSPLCIALQHTVASVLLLFTGSGNIPWIDS